MQRQSPEAQYQQNQWACGGRQCLKYECCCKKQIIKHASYMCNSGSTENLNDQQSFTVVQFSIWPNVKCGQSLSFCSWVLNNSQRTVFAEYPDFYGQVKLWLFGYKMSSFHRFIRWQTVWDVTVISVWIVELWQKRVLLGHADLDPQILISSSMRHNWGWCQM